MKALNSASHVIDSSSAIATPDASFSRAKSPGTRELNGSSTNSTWYGLNAASAAEACSNVQARLASRRMMAASPIAVRSPAKFLKSSSIVPAPTLSFNVS